MGNNTIPIASLSYDKKKLMPLIMKILIKILNHLYHEIVVSKNRKDGQENKPT